MVAVPKPQADAQFCLRAFTHSTDPGVGFYDRDLASWLT